MARRPAELERPPAANIIHECPHCKKHSYIDLGQAQAFDRDRADRDEFGEEPTERISGFGRFGEAFSEGGDVPPTDADLGRKTTSAPPDEWRNPDIYQGESDEVKQKQEASRRAGLSPPVQPPPQTTAKLALGGPVPARRDGLGKVDGIHTDPRVCEHLAAGGQCHHFAPGQRRAKEDAGDEHVRNFAEGGRATDGGFANYLVQQQAARGGRYRKAGRGKE